MDAKEMAARSPKPGTEQELAERLERLARIPRLDLYQKKFTATFSCFGGQADQGHILILGLSEDNVVGPAIAAIELDRDSCDELLKTLFGMRRQFRAMAKFRSSTRQ